MIKSPLRPAMTQPLTSPYDLITRYFRPNNGTGDSGDLLTPIVIPAGADFKIQSWVSVDNFDTFYQIFSGDRTTFNTQASTGLLTLFLPILTGGSVSRSTTGVIDLNKLNNVVVRVTAGDLFISINGVEEEMVALPALDDFIISRFCGRTNIGSSSQYVGIMPPTMVWINDVLTDWYKFDDPNSVYQRNHAVPQGVELYSDSFALPEFFSRDGNIITKTDTTSETIFIANVEAGKHYRLSFRKDSHSAGSPNLRDQFNNQYIFPLMSPLESSGKTYEFVFTAITDGQVGINGAASLWSVSELSIKEFHGCEIIGGMPEDWFQVERQPHWDYWLGPEQWGVGAVSEYGSSTYDSESGIAHITNGETTNLSGVLFNNGVIGCKYLANLTVFDFVKGIAIYKAGTDLTGYEFSENGHYSGDIVADGVNMDIKRKAGYSVDLKVKNISFRRKLEIAQ